MSEYVTVEEMREFVGNEIAKAATGLVKLSDIRAKDTMLAIQLGVTAETMAFVSLLCHKNISEVIAHLESTLEAQHASFLYTTMTDEQIASHRQRLSRWLDALRKSKQ